MAHKNAVTIAIATRPGRDEQLARALEAYERESPAAQIIVVSAAADDWRAQAWREAAADEQLSGWLVHFGSDQLEPHPGWLEAARAAVATKRIPTPQLWDADGSRQGDRLDWARSEASEFPTMSRIQLADFGPPPFPAKVKAVARYEYAFTFWAD